MTSASKRTNKAAKKSASKIDISKHPNHIPGISSTDPSNTSEGGPGLADESDEVSEEVVPKKAAKVKKIFDDASLTPLSGEDSGSELKDPSAYEAPKPVDKKAAKPAKRTKAQKRREKKDLIKKEAALAKEAKLREELATKETKQAK
jgi:hypothetical protein